MKKKALYEIWEKNKQVMVTSMGAKRPPTFPHHLKQLEHPPSNPEDILLSQFWTLIVDYLSSHGTHITNHCVCL